MRPEAWAEPSSRFTPRSRPAPVLRANAPRTPPLAEGGPRPVRPVQADHDLKTLTVVHGPALLHRLHMPDPSVADTVRSLPWFAEQTLNIGAGDAAVLGVHDGSLVEIASRDGRPHGPVSV